MKSWLKFLIKTIIGIVILGILIYTVDIQQVWSAIKTINLWWIIPALMFLGLHYLFCIINLKVVVDRFQEIKLKDAAQYYFMTLAAGAILPSRLGDLSIMLFLKKEKIDNHKIGAIFMMLTGLSFLFAISVALIGLYYFFGKVMLPLIAISAAGIILCILMLNYGSWLKLFLKIMPQFIRKHIEKYTDAVQFFMDDKKRLYRIAGIMLLRWGCKAMYLFFLFLAFREFVWPQVILLVMCTEIFTTVIPITVGGTGFRESLAVYLFGLRGIAQATTLSVYLLQLFIFYIVVIISLSFLKLKEVKQ
jgi:uncharacterized protein (TIRG00374 family)